MTKGREVPELPEFRFESGYSVHIQKVSPFLATEVARAFPPPPPPKNEVDYGDGPVFEENPDDPDYQEALKAHQATLAEKIGRIALKRGLVINLTDDEIQALLTKTQTEIKEEEGIEIIFEEKNPRIAYLLYICGPNAHEMQALTNKIFGLSQPTEAAIADAEATF